MQAPRNISEYQHHENKHMQRLPPQPSYYCECNLPAKVAVSNSQKNPGKTFACCPKYKEDQSKCRYFKWLDSTPAPSQFAGGGFGSQTGHGQEDSYRPAPQSFSGPPTSQGQLYSAPEAVAGSPPSRQHWETTPDEQRKRQRTDGPMTPKELTGYQVRESMEAGFATWSKDMSKMSENTAEVIVLLATLVEENKELKQKVASVDKMIAELKECIQAVLGQQ